MTHNVKTHFFSVEVSFGGTSEEIQNDTCMQDCLRNVDFVSKAPGQLAKKNKRNKKMMQQDFYKRKFIFHPQNSVKQFFLAFGYFNGCAGDNHPGKKTWTLLLELN